MEAFKYRIITEWSDEDQVFVARVPALGPACAAHGDSAERAAKEVQVAASAMLEVMAEQGEALPAPDASADYSGQLRLRLPKSLHERVTQLAAADDVSVNTMLLTLISEGIGSRGRERHIDTFPDELARNPPKKGLRQAEDDIASLRRRKSKPAREAG